VLVKSIIITAALFASFAYGTNAPIDCSHSILKADYQIQQSNSNSANNSNAQTMTLWRNGPSVAHQLDQQQIIESWYKGQNHKVQLTRYFDQFNRGIEYQPSELNNKSSNNQQHDWHKTNSLISANMLASLTKTKTVVADNSCDTVEFYHSQPATNNHSKTVTLQWLPALQLVKQLKLESATHSKTWTLQNTAFDHNAVKHQFAQWRNYKTTDYADIGDSEDDPFLQKMINLGFNSGHKH